MGAYSIRPDAGELSSLVERAEAGEEVVLSRDGRPVAKLIPFPESHNVASRSRRPADLQLSDPRMLDLLDEPFSEEEQRAFGMIDGPDGESREESEPKEPRPYGQNFSGVGKLPENFDDPWPEDMQRAFGMLD